MWHHITPKSTGFYKKEPRPSISTFNTYDLAEVLEEAKEPSPVEEEFPPFEEPDKESTDDLEDESEDEDTTEIRHSPIVTSPPPYMYLPIPMMASTSTTTQTTAAQSSTTSAPPPSSPNQIVAKFCQSFNLPGLPSGKGGGNGGRGGRGAPAPQQPQQPQQQQNVAPAADVKAMGKLPNTFDRD